MSTPLANDSSHAPLEKQLAVRLLLLLTDGATGVAVAAILVVVLAQVVGRLLGAPFSWTEELTRACFIWMVFAGVAAGTIEPGQPVKVLGQGDISVAVQVKVQAFSAAAQEKIAAAGGSIEKV